MSDKTEFARIVPAMIQEKAADWLLNKLDDELEAITNHLAGGAQASNIIPGSLRGAAFRGRLIRETFIAQYANEETTNGSGNNTVVNNITITSPEVGRD